MADNEPLKVFKLKHPIKFGSETIDTLEINRRLKAKDLKEMPTSNQRMGDMMKIVSKLFAQPMKVIEELDAEDLLEITEVVNDFLPSSLATGESR